WNLVGDPLRRRRRIRSHRGARRRVFPEHRTNPPVRPFGRRTPRRVVCGTVGDRVPPRCHTSPLPVHGLVTAGAVLDLAAGAREGIGEDAVVEFLDGGPEDVPERYAEADPIRRVPTNVPTYCVHSAKDERVPFGQSVRYIRAARQAG